MPPPHLPIDLANFPSLRTRKALLILDAQNEFLAPGSALSVQQPEGFVERTLAVARAFRSSGSGDVFWIRSQFECHRPTAETHLMTTDVLQASRSRRQPPLPKDDQDADPEAFLSIGGEEPLVKETQAKRFYPGSIGSELLPDVLATVDTRQDLVFAKTHYSAFQCSQLLMRLRTHFVTELFICGALTNISVFATALDAARHGLALTLIEDCCGYRSEIRHQNAVAGLVQLTGCEMVDSDCLIQSLESAPAPEDRRVYGNRTASGAAAGASGMTGRPKTRPKTRPSTRRAPEGPIGVSGKGDDASAARPGGSLPVRTRAPASDELEKKGKDKMEADEGALGPSESCSEPPSHDEAPKLSHAPLVAEALSKTAQPQPSQPVQPMAAVTPASNGPILGLVPEVDHDSRPATADRLAVSSKRREVAESRPDHENTTAEAASQPSGEEAGKEDDTAPAVDDSKDRSPPTSAIPHEDAAGSPVTESTVPSPADEDLADKVTGTEPLCEGDTIMYHNVLPPSIEDGIYDRLCEEVHWLRMTHQGGEVPRLVCVQGDMDEDGNMPIYRHPADESPPMESFSPAVLKIKARIEEIAGHPLNHALIQLYRTGHDYISEHSDKTLDIVPGSFVCNVSLGAERTFVFRTKRTDKDHKDKTDLEQNAESKDAEGGVGDDTGDVGDEKKRQICRVQLPHNSLCRMGLQTNMRWLHAIRQDKRMDRDKTAAELAYGGGRISLTFRQIGTFMNSDQTLIWGQGARSASQKDAGTVVNGQTDEAIRMLKAFGTENHSSEFDWEKHYGEGFDVLHIGTAARLFSSSDPAANLSIQLMLAEFGMGYAKGSIGETAEDGDGSAGTSILDLPVRFADRDGSVVDGVLAIMLYLDSVYGRSKGAVAEKLEAARTFTRLQQALKLQDTWRSVHKTADAAEATSNKSLLSGLAGELTTWNGYASGGKFTGGGNVASLADFGFWPVLHELEKACDGGEAGLMTELKRLKLDHLVEYYSMFKAREKVQQACSP